MFLRPLYILKNFLFSLLPIKTVGVRILVLKNNKVLLVKHTYVPGWHTIGGAVDKNESPEKAIKREVFEEVNIEAKEVSLFNLYHNTNEKRDDYVALYVCEDFIEHPWTPNTEIKEKKWFDLKSLPEEATPATIRRIHEYQRIKEISSQW